MQPNLLQEKDFRKTGDYMLCTSRFIASWYYYTIRSFCSIRELNYCRLFLNCGRSYAYSSQICPSKDFDYITEAVATTRKQRCHQLAYETLASWHLSVPEQFEKRWRVVWGYVDAIENGNYTNTYMHSFLVFKNTLGENIILDPMNMYYASQKEKNIYLTNHYGIELPLSWLNPASGLYKQVGCLYTPHSIYIPEKIFPSKRKTSEFIDLILKNRL